MRGTTETAPRSSFRGYPGASMFEPDPLLLYKVCSAAAWREAVATGTYRASGVDLRDGFIHLSTGAQLADTLRLHFAGQSDLVLFEVDPADLGDALRWEPSRGGESFPHLYGALPVSLARRVVRRA
jgi:uncharacterized protein (DUF952 family)